MFNVLSLFTVLLLLQGSSAFVEDKEPQGMPHVEDNLLHNETPLRINGHLLPPMPDKSLNDKSVAGVDVNHNDVRDDVERWIYMTYKDKHPIYIDIAMQAARGYKLVLEHPERAKEIHDEVNSALDCELYYRYCVDDININEKQILNENDEIDNKYFRQKIYFNTKERMDAYIKYDDLLSGGVYTLPRCKQQKEKCDFNTSKYD